MLEQRSRYLTVVLDDIYQAQNSSAIMRTCECVGIQDLHVIEDRNKHKTNRDIVQGASKWVDLHRYENEGGRIECIEKLKQQDYRIVAMTLSEGNIPLEELPVNEKLSICFGSEDAGLNTEIKKSQTTKYKSPSPASLKAIMSPSAQVSAFII